MWEESIAYKVEKQYYRSCEEDYKLRYINHMQYLRHKSYKSKTELSKYILGFTEAPYTIKWSIAAYSSSYISVWIMYV